MEHLKKVLRFLIRTLSVCAILFGLTVLFTIGYVESRFGGQNRINLPPSAQRLEQEKKAFKVAVFGDFAMQSSVIIPILHDVNGRGFDFAVSIGDMMRRPIGGEGDYVLEQLKDNLSLPFVTVIGNHDLQTGKDPRVYEHSFGCTMYYFGYGETLFVALNDADSKMDKSRLGWLENVLKMNRSLYRRCVIMMHIPPLSYSGNVMHVRTSWADDFYSVISKYGIDAIVSGHLHIAEKLNFEGIPVFISPASGQKIRDTVHPYYGYMEIVFAEDGSISSDYHFFPELKRGRNHFLCAIMNYFPGNKTFFYGSILLVAAGFLVLKITRKIPAEAEKTAK